MARDDVYLQRVWAHVRNALCPELRARAAAVHVYPARGCTYAVDKRRIFAAVVTDDGGERLAPCALAHVLLHELAHVLNLEDVGHGAAFRATVARIDACLGATTTVAACPDRVPPDYNAACRSTRPAAAVAGT